MTLSPETQAMIARIMNYEDEPKPVKKKKATGVSRRGSNLTNHGPKYDYAKIVELHNSGLRQTEIAMEMGCSEQTVRTALTQAFPEGYRVNRGPRKRAFCEQGHDDWKVFPSDPDRRYCATCQREYSRTRYRKNKGIPLDAPVRGASPLCPKNHEPAWEYFKRSNGYKERQCRTCRQERQREAYARKKQENGM